MAKKPTPKSDDKEQSQRFVETAESLGIDKNGKSFEQSFKAIIENKIPIKKQQQ
ncbi:MAG: hypothetical protein ACLQHK_01645 [Gallionellaceae bacterium]